MPYKKRLNFTPCRQIGKDGSEFVMTDYYKTLVEICRNIDGCHIVSNSDHLFRKYLDFQDVSLINYHYDAENRIILRLKT